MKKKIASNKNSDENDYIFDDLPHLNKKKRKLSEFPCVEELCTLWSSLAGFHSEWCHTFHLRKGFSSNFIPGVQSNVSETFRCHKFEKSCERHGGQYPNRRCRAGQKQTGSPGGLRTGKTCHDLFTLRGPDADLLDLILLRHINQSDV